MLPKPVKDEYRRSTSVSSQTNVEMPMRDGVILRADVYRPTDGGRHPVLLQRIPYGKHYPALSQFVPRPHARVGPRLCCRNPRGSRSGTYRAATGIHTYMRPRMATIRLTG